MSCESLTKGFVPMKSKKKQLNEQGRFEHQRSRLDRAMIKQGFALPVGSWFRSGDLRLTGRLDPLDEAVVHRRNAAHRDGERDDRLFLYCQWVLEHFAERLG